MIDYLRKRMIFLYKNATSEDIILVNSIVWLIIMSFLVGWYCGMTYGG